MGFGVKMPCSTTGYCICYLCKYSQSTVYVMIKLWSYKLYSITPSPYPLKKSWLQVHQSWLVWIKTNTVKNIFFFLCLSFHQIASGFPQCKYVYNVHKTKWCNNLLLYGASLFGWNTQNNALFSSAVAKLVPSVATFFCVCH